jgi:hypothetical protein
MSKAKGKSTKKKKLKKKIRKKIIVDFWKTDLHGEEIGIRQKEQQRAKSRQFSKDMDLYGAVEIDGDDAGNIGYRTNEWEEKDLADGELRRLVIRYFTEATNWIASIEEDSIASLRRSIAHEEELPVFNIFLRGDQNIYKLERVEREYGQMDKVIVQLILEEDSKIVDFFMFDEKRFTIGSDWKVYRPNDDKRILAEFNSKKFNIGGKVEIKIYDPELAENKNFVNTLILFAALIKFWDNANDDLKNSFKEIIENDIVFQPNRFELDLLKNPRRYVR